MKKVNIQVVSHSNTSMEDDSDGLLPPLNPKSAPAHRTFMGYPNLRQNSSKTFLESNGRKESIYHGHNNANGRKLFTGSHSAPGCRRGVREEAENIVLNKYPHWDQNNNCDPLDNVRKPKIPNNLDKKTLSLTITRFEPLKQNGLIDNNNRNVSNIPVPINKGIIVNKVHQKPNYTNAFNGDVKLNARSIDHSLNLHTAEKDYKLPYLPNSSSLSSNNVQQRNGELSASLRAIHNSDNSVRCSKDIKSAKRVTFHSPRRENRQFPINEHKGLGENSNIIIEEIMAEPGIA